MDGDQQVGPERVGALRAPQQLWPADAFGDQHPHPGETRLAELGLDLPRQLEIEDIFRHAAGAARAARLHGMADVEDDPEIRRIAGGGGDGVQRQADREDHQADHSSSIPPLQGQGGARSAPGGVAAPQPHPVG